MQSKTYPESLKFINTLPVISISILWILQIFLTIDKEFLLASAWPTPYKDAFNEDFTLYYIFYSVIILLIGLLSIVRSKFTAAVFPIVFIFEAYTLLSPILYKALYYNTAQAIRYSAAIFDITDKLFYLHTLKSIILLAGSVMTFFAILSNNKKTVLVLFSVSILVIVAFLIFETVNLSTSNSISLHKPELVSKSAIIGITRMVTLLPAFFIGFNEKTRTI